MDRHEEQKRWDKDRERREDRREAYIKQQEWEMKNIRRIEDNPDALRVLTGAEDARLNAETMGRAPDPDLEDPDVAEEIRAQIQAVRSDPTLSAEDKQFQTLLWRAADLDKRIERLAGEIAAAAPDQIEKLQAQRRTLEERRERFMQQIRDHQNQSQQRLRDLMRGGRP